MSDTRAVRRTQDELVAELKRRFGDDPMDWAFRCPSCGDVANGRDFKAALAASPDEKLSKSTASEHLGQICIGRLLGALRKDQKRYAGRGCDWAAFGLFRGPEFVVAPDGHEIACFAIAPGKATRGA
jgi:hypothetical protein